MAQAPQRYVFLPVLYISSNKTLDFEGVVQYRFNCARQVCRKRNDWRNNEFSYEQ